MATTQRRRNDVIALSAAVALAAAACSNPKTIVGPTGTTSSTPVATPPPTAGPAVAFTKLTISGPNLLRIPDGRSASAQYTATATASDGSTVDVTDKVSWQSSNVTVLRATDRPGEMEPQDSGSSTIFASIGQVKGFLGVHVLGAGLFIVSGVVRAAGGGGLAQATVHVTDGTKALWAQYGYTGDNSGTFTLEGVGGDVELTVTAQGFATTVQRFSVDRDMNVDIALRPLADPLDLSGSWSITLSTSASCRDKLPEEARDRQIDAVITQESAQIRIALTGPALEDFQRVPMPFIEWGSVSADRVSFGIQGDTGYDTWSYPELFQRLNATQAVGIDGTITADATRNEIRGQLNGDIELFRDSNGFYDFSQVCRATDHSVVMRRQ